MFIMMRIGSRKYEFRMPSNPLVSVSQLKQKLADSHVVVLDASMRKPLPGIANPISAQAIPGAFAFDIEEVFVEAEAPFPHTMPGPQTFHDAWQKLGVPKECDIVVYDNMGVYSSPRAWWMLRAFGCPQVSVLDGGLPAWIDAGEITQPLSLPARQEWPQPQDADESYAEGIVSAGDVLRGLNEDIAEVIDARSASRFLGQEEEPRAGVRRGHIPGSKNLHFRDLTHNGFLKDEAELKRCFEALSLDSNKRLIMTCGSGITACILALAAYKLGYRELSVFDGSWAEWGATTSLPVATGN